MDPALPPILINIILVVVGLSFGSFATAMAHRVPIRKKMGGGARSACPHCNHDLAVRDLIPVVSWAIAGGKCRYCKKNIGMSYPLTELGVLLACLSVYWVRGMSVDTALIIASIPFLAALLVIDLRHMILPDGLMMIVAIIGVARLIAKAVMFHDVPELELFTEYLFNIFFFAGISFLIGLVMTKVTGKDSLGMGDVKFFAMAGVWLGLSQFGWFCALSGILGVLFAVIFRKTGKGQAFPFGPALIASLFILVLTDGSLF